MKFLLKKFLPDFVYFYKHLRYRMIFLLLTSIFVGLLDGLGLTMFLPLLELVADENATASSEKLGQLSFLLDGLEYIGFQLTLTVVLLTMFGFFVFKGIATFFERYVRVVYQQYFIAKIRMEIIRALANYNYNAFVSADAGAIQNTMSGEVERVMQSFRTYSTILQQFVMILAYAGLAFLASPEFAVLITVGGVLSNFLFGALYRKTKILSSELVVRNNTFQGYIIQVVAFFKYLKATSTIQKYILFLEKKVLDIEETNRKMGVLNSIMMGLREPMMIGVVVGVILIQINVLGGGLGTIILSLLFFYRALTSLTALQTSYNQFLGFSGSLVNMSNFVDDLKAHPTVTGKTPYKGFKNEISLRHISFGYSENRPVLKDINFKIEKNQSVAFVGESGSGKTTLLNIVTGLITPTSGECWIDDIKVSDLNIQSFQKRIGYITQDPVVFDDSVFNNVTIWEEKTKENLARFQEALRKAHIDEFVSGLEGKEDSRLGNNGISLSGGQKQRISIARELYKEVDFLFMDEATSALDSETERSIQQCIDELKGKYTLITIAHRLTTIKNADQIIVLDKGEMVSMGTFEELIESSEKFKNSVALQNL
ncbi:ABC transporter ATP-binding protein [Rhodonellum sp.]|uniref:ABC transporter ATP-binding protein n=1 Tax=Rhodonellum sp. TaxID=2231180 RepID=UPI0027174E8B|nr:ABC transporter ATP-binding protein [Rhodonellum sp.]MDO9551540.1 ABC transporter ATP-binding protein [Rhodonellum sp.]